MRIQRAKVIKLAEINLTELGRRDRQTRPTPQFFK